MKIWAASFILFLASPRQSFTCIVSKSCFARTPVNVYGNALRTGCYNKHTFVQSKLSCLGTALMSLPGNGVCQQFLSHSMKRWAASPNISLQTCASQFTCNKAETGVISVKWLRILLREMPLWKFHPIVTTVTAKERTPSLHFKVYLSDLMFRL